MAENNVIEIIAKGVKRNHFDIALFTTFNFEFEFFNRFMFATLTKSRLQKMSLFADGKQLSKSINSIITDSIDINKYYLTPVNMVGSFHPKLILLLGKGCAQLVIGSGNLTQNGYCSNNEIFNVFEYSKKEPSYGSVIYSALTLFNRLGNEFKTQDRSIFNEINKLELFDSNPTIDENISLIHNLDQSILSQLNLKDIKEVDVAVPFYDNDLYALGEIKKLCPEAKINLYIQNMKARFPKEKASRVDNILLFNGINEPKNNNFYHGKSIRFKSSNEEFILYGSANCTGSALTRSYKEGGNIECDILQKGKLGEFDYYFNNFIKTDEEMNVECLTYDSVYPKLSFVKSELNESGITFIIRSSMKLEEPIKIVLDDSDYTNFEISNNEIIIKDIPLENKGKICSFFITFNKTTEKVCCWIHDEEAIRTFRNIQYNDVFDNVVDIEKETDNRKFIEYEQRLLSSIPNTIEALQVEKSVQLDQKVDDDAEQEESGTPTGFVQFELTDSESDMASTIKRRREFFVKKMNLHREKINELLRLMKDPKTRARKKTRTTGETKGGRKYKGSKFEKRFCRDIVAIMKNISSTEYLNQVSFETLYSTDLIINEILDRFFYTSLFYEAEKILIYDYKIVMALLDKIKTEQIEDKYYQQAVVISGFKNYLLASTYNIKSNDYYKLSNCIFSNLGGEEARTLFDISNYELNCSDHLFEEIFNYSQYFDTNKLLEYFRKVYEIEDVKIEVKDKILHVGVQIDFKMQRDFSLSERIKVIAKFVKLGYKDINAIDIISTFNPGEKYKKFIRHTFDLVKETYTRTISYLNGNAEVEEPEMFYLE